MSMMLGPCGVSMMNSDMAVPVGMYGDFAMSCLASCLRAHRPRKWSYMPPMTGRCMQMAVVSRLLSVCVICSRNASHETAGCSANASSVNALMCSIGRSVCQLSTCNVSWQRSHGEVASRVGLKQASSRLRANAIAAPFGVIGRFASVPFHDLRDSAFAWRTISRFCAVAAPSCTRSTNTANVSLSVE